MIWIRFERYLRFHAVYTTHLGASITWCGRMCRVGSESERSTDPVRRCSHCASRLRCPYLVPDELRELAGAKQLARRTVKRAHPDQLELAV